MKNIFDCSLTFLLKNSFPEIKPIKDETQEEKTLSNTSPKNDISDFFCQINESLFFQNDEDSNKIIWQDSENILNDFSKESPFSIRSNEKTLLTNYPLSLSIDDNISMEKSSSFFQNKDIYCLNESEFEGTCLNIASFNEDEEKISCYLGDSFLSILELSPSQEYINFGNNKLNLNIEDRINNDSKESDIREPINEIKEKRNSDKNISAECKKKPKINFCVSRKGNNNLNNCDNNVLETKNESENEFIHKKRERSNKQSSEIKKNSIKYNNLHEINRVTILSPKAYKCECGKIFSTQENQRLHYINIHLHEKPYNCSFCGEGFSHRNGKIYHERVYHTFIFPYPCNSCNSAFASKSAMIYHIKSKHKVN